MEFCGTEDTQWAKAKLNSLIAFVNDSDDAAFRTQLKDHLDVDSAIDYLLCVYALGLTEHKAANMILVTYGQNEPWTASLYDLGTAFGLSADGQRLAHPEEFLPVRRDGQWDSDTGNLLWDRLLQNYMPQLKSRYAQLRQTVLTPEAIGQRVAEFYDPVPEDLRLANAQMYPAKCEGSDDPEMIATYITQRLALLDPILSEKGS